MIEARRRVLIGRPLGLSSEWCTVRGAKVHRYPVMGHHQN